MVNREFVNGEWRICELQIVIFIAKTKKISQKVFK
jgi:hypothetical protein